MIKGNGSREISSIKLSDVSSGCEAWIAPHLGFNCYRFQTRVNQQLVDVIDAPEDFGEGFYRPSSAGCPILFPFPNRVEKGVFAWDNKRITLPESMTLHDPEGNAIHGFCLDRPWRILDRNENSVRGIFQLSLDAPDRLSCWPCDFILTATYRLQNNRLTMDFEIENPSSVLLPWGLGLHPYFRIPLNSMSDGKHCLIEAPVEKKWVLDASLPTGKLADETFELPEGAYFDLLDLDDIFSIDQTDATFYQSIIFDERAGLQMTLTCQNDFRFLVVYTPSHRGSVCLEPYTCLTNAINLQNHVIDAGLRTLQPGEKHHLQLAIEASAILV